MRTTCLCFLLLLLPLRSFALNCQAEYQKHVQTDLDLPYEQFDQTLNGGMRVLGNAGCHKEAADLLEAYIQKNHATENSLYWHIAQERAMADDYPRAIVSAKKVLMDKEEFAKEPLRWNDYVLASIAFWEGNKEALVAHRNEVAKGVNDYVGNQLNLKLLDVLIDNFGTRYRDAVAKL